MFCVAGVTQVATAVPPTPAEIEQSIQKGLAWLATQQTASGTYKGNWGGSSGYRGGQTGLILTKFAERAHELGQDPFATSGPNAYQYAQNVIDGFQWLIDQMYSISGGLRIDAGSHPGYVTGIAMTAMAATRAPARVHTSTNGAVNNKTYDEILQGLVTYSEAVQVSSGFALGAWHYSGAYSGGDNSPCGYTVLGLRSAEAANLHGFTISIQTSTKTDLKTWVDYIQNDTSGGSGYTSPTRADPTVNLLKTGNLLFQATFAASDDVDPALWYQSRVDEAIRFIQNNWNATHSGWWTVGWRTGSSLNLQTMYNLMKGFAAVDIDEITVSGSPIDWFGGDGQFAERLVGTQHISGYWSNYYDYGGDLTATAWALLTLEKLAPPPSTSVSIDLAGEICDNDALGGYTVDVTYTSQTANVEGTVVVNKDGILHDTIVLYNFIGSVTVTYGPFDDAAGIHSWTADMTVEPQGGGTESQTDDTASIEVIAAPVVGDIPDQTTPFTTFDLDTYLTYGGALAVTWSSSGNSCLQVAIDGENVVTVTNPGDACEDPETITFTASVEGVEAICSSSDDAIFTPNQPPVAVCTDVTAKSSSDELDENCEASVTIDDGSYDPDGDEDIESIIEDPAGPYSLGETEVELTITDKLGESDTCTGIVTVIDDTPPTVDCGVIPEDLNLAGSELPKSFTATGDDNCSVDVSVAFTRCTKIKKGIEVETDCEVSADGDTITITEIGKGKTAYWTATAVDGSGNSVSAECSAGRGACNQGVGNGPEDCDPGNSNQGDPANSNDENGGTPGNPGKKGGKK